MENRTLGERIATVKREIRSRSTEGIERRTVAARVEVRASSTDEAYTIEGHAAVFDDLSEDLGFFEPWFERIEPGAFKTVLSKAPDVRALFNHDPNYVLARTKSGTLRVSEDDDGLLYEADIDGGTDIGKRLRSSLTRRDVDQSSFAFRVARKGDSWEEDDEGRLIRTIHKFSELYDVSPVTYPAYPTTDVGTSSRNSDDDDDPDDEGTGVPTGTEVLEGTAPTDEREDDEPAGQRVHDGDGEGQQAGLNEREKRRERLRLRVGEPPL